MKEYENLKIKVIVWQQEDVLTTSGGGDTSPVAGGLYEGTSNIGQWFGGGGN